VVESPFPQGYRPPSNRDLRSAGFKVLIGERDLHALFPPDNRWRESTGALCDEERTNAYERVFAAWAKGWKGENARIVWGWSVNGQYVPIAPPSEA